CIASFSILVLIIGPAYSTPTGEFLQNVFQKIIIYAECFVLFLLAYGSISYLKEEGSSKTSITPDY
ncbi:MAG: hypothetical protein ACW98F_10845, partial [Candidatus Hodarchaeales archaeon]